MVGFDGKTGNPYSDGEWVEDKNGRLRFRHPAPDQPAPTKASHLLPGRFLEMLGFVVTEDDPGAGDYTFLRHHGPPAIVARAMQDHIRLDLASEFNSWAGCPEHIDLTGDWDLQVRHAIDRLRAWPGPEGDGE